MGKPCALMMKGLKSKEYAETMLLDHDEITEQTYTLCPEYDGITEKVKTVYEGDIKTSLGRKVDDGIGKITSPVFSFLVDDLASGNNILYTT